MKLLYRQKFEWATTLMIRCLPTVHSSLWLFFVWWWSVLTYNNIYFLLCFDESFYSSSFSFVWVVRFVFHFTKNLLHTFACVNIHAAIHELDLCTLKLCHCQSKFSADTMKSGRVFIVCTGFFSLPLLLTHFPCSSKGMSANRFHSRDPLSIVSVLVCVCACA